MDQNAKVTSKEDNQFPWLALVIGPVISIHMFCFVGTSLLLQQYAYHAVQVEKFPELNQSSQVEFTCESNTTSDKYILQVETQEETSTLILYFSLASGIPAIFINFLVGCYSDRYGRKKLLVFTLIGLFLKTGMISMAIYFQWNIYIFIAFHAIEGLSGAQMGPMTMAFSISADITSRGKSRTFGIALIDVSIGIGIILGSFTSGYLIRYLGFAPPFALAAGLYFLDMVLVIVLLPETRHVKEHAEHVPLKQNVKDAFSFYVDKEGHRWIYIICTLIFLMVLVSNVGKNYIDALYELNNPFCWQSIQIGIFAMLTNVAKFNIGIPSIRLFQKCLSDESITMIGLVSNTLSLIQEGVAPNSIVLYLVPVVGVGAMMPIPLTRGIMSKITSAEKQGALFSGTGAISAICSVLGSIIGNGIYTGTVGIYRGLAYLIMAVPSGIAIVLLIFLKVKQNPKHLKIKTDYTVQLEKSISMPTKDSDNSTRM